MSFRAAVSTLYLWGFISLPCILPRGSFSSAHPSSPVRGDLIWFSPWGERYRGVAASDRLEDKLCPSCVVLYEPPAVSAAHLHPRSSCVCWGHHHHHRCHNLASCLQNRLHHLYWGCHHHLFLLLHRCDRWLQAFNVVCSRRSLLRHQWPSFPPSCRPPAPDLPLQWCLRPHRFWALGPAVCAFSGSW